MKESQWYYSPWSHSCDVIRSRKQETIVFSKLSRGQVVVDALHHNVDIVESSSTASLLHIATDTYMDLKRSTGYVM